MKSAAVPSFWEAYASLDESIKRRARKAFQLWEQHPFHPSLRFKCINREEDIWSVRKVLRRLVWHELLHWKSIKRIVREYYTKETI
ncbi:MAG TPA: hypothetical protein ENH11_05100 [Candidatus Acetothermia bacterium]|nr:hypothetical protein [Candidatus Acetothermia bacterium]